MVWVTSREKKHPPIPSDQCFLRLQALRQRLHDVKSTSQDVQPDEKRGLGHDLENQWLISNTKLVGGWTTHLKNIIQIG